MDHHVHAAITEGLRQRGVDVLTVHEDWAAQFDATVYGVVTTGSAWRFLSFVETVVYIDRAEYYIKEVERIVGILVAMIREAQSPQAQPHTD
jgi:hypothetical protein